MRLFCIDLILYLNGYLKNVFFLKIIHLQLYQKNIIQIFQISQKYIQIFNNNQSKRNKESI
jgi:hypothetical protein